MASNFLSNTPKDLQRDLHSASRRVEEQETSSRAVSQHIPYINLQGFPLDLNTLAMFTEQEAKDSQAVPFFKEGHDLRIGAVDPDSSVLAEKIAGLDKKYQVSVYLISPGGLAETIKLYAKVLVPKAATSEVIRVEKEVDSDKIFEELKLDPELKRVPASEFLTRVFAAAMALKASDIHYEPEEKFLKVRFRLDGLLQDMLHVDRVAQKPLISRLKILSKLKINVENQPQDGRLTFYYLGKPVDVRVSSLPSGYGEGVVLRLLTTEAANLKFSDLGLEGRNKEVIEKALSKPNGMMLTCGPTGSGKTTTLYAFLNELNDPGVKIITLEDPIEYKLPGVQQTPIDHRVNFSFADGLRAILRQDPDIVMVGEIRDQETAETALQAALTGHIVLSTLHTNDAVGAVPRLLQMGVKPFVIAPAMNAIIAQRLVRKLCQACKQPQELDKLTREKVQGLLKTIPSNAGVTVPHTLSFFHSKGCKECHNLGYRGRIGIFEVVEINDAMEALILKDPSGGDFRKQSVSDGTISMAQDGILKALQGITDIDEVFRVAES